MINKSEIDHQHESMCRSSFVSACEVRNLATSFGGASAASCLATARAVASIARYNGVPGMTGRCRYSVLRFLLLVIGVSTVVAPFLKTKKPQQDPAGAVTRFNVFERSLTVVDADSLPEARIDISYFCADATSCSLPAAQKRKRTESSIPSISSCDPEQVRDRLRFHSV